MTVAPIHQAAQGTVELFQPTSLARWAQEAREAANVAVSLAKTPFVPASLRDRDAGITAANITAAILTGQELGLEPMAALRSIDIIQGVPALRAVALRAIVLAAGHDLWLEESTNTRAIVRGRRRGSDQIQESAWTLDRAKALGLTGKDNWRRQPGAMLVARATAECARLIAADAILGVAYSAEELDDGDAEQVALTPQAAPAAKRTAQRRTPQRPAIARPPVEESEPDPEPDFDEPATEPTPEPDPITDAQMRKLQALFHDLGINDRNERLAEVGAFLGRDLTSSKELTRDETSRLIDDLQRRLDPTPEDEGQEMP